MAGTRTQPIGIELVKRSVVTEEDIKNALEYQKTHNNMRIGDILYELNVCDPQILIEAIGDIIGEKAIVLTTNNIKINVTDYISLDVAKRNKAIPFEVEAGKIKVCFSETTNTRTIEAMRLLFLNKGLVMEKYITFTQIINSILTSFESTAEEEIDVNADISGLLDSVIKTAM